MLPNSKIPLTHVCTNLFLSSCRFISQFIKNFSIVLMLANIFSLSIRNRICRRRVCMHKVIVIIAIYGGILNFISTMNFLLSALQLKNFFAFIPSFNFHRSASRVFSSSWDFALITTTVEWLKKFFLLCFSTFFH